MDDRISASRSTFENGNFCLLAVLQGDPLIGVVISLTTSVTKTAARASFGGGSVVSNAGVWGRAVSHHKMYPVKSILPTPESKEPNFVSPPGSAAREWVTRSP